MNFQDKKVKKKLKHKAEMPLHVISIILSTAIAFLVVFLLINLPENPQFKDLLTQVFGLDKNFVENFVDLGIFALDAIFIIMLLYLISTYIKNYGKASSNEVRVSHTQMTEYQDIIDRFASKLGIDHPPHLFFKEGKLDVEVYNVKLHFPNVIRMNANFGKSMYDVDNYEKSVEFYIAKELARDYLCHTNIFLMLYTITAKMLPIYGNMYERVLNYSTDKVAAALVGNGAEEALAKSVVKPKNTTYLNNAKLFIKEYEEMSKAERASLVYNNLFSDESPVAYRILAIRNKKDGRLF